MLLVILITLIVVGILFFGYQKNKNNLCIIALISILALIVVFLLFYIARMSYLPYGVQIENIIFLFAYQQKLSPSQLKTLLNIVIAIFFATLWITGILNFKKTASVKNIKFLMFILSPIVILLFLYLNSPSMLENIYLMKNTDSCKIEFSEFLDEFIKTINYMIIAYFCVVPYLLRIDEYHQTNIMFKKTELVVVFLSIAFIEMLFVLLTCISPLRYFAFETKYLYDTDLIQISYDDFVYTYLPIIFITVYITIIVLLSKYGIIDCVAMFKKRFLIKRTNISANDIRYIFHSYKNSLLSIIALEDKAKENYGTKEGLMYLEKIRLNAIDFSERAGHFLDVYNMRMPELNKTNVLKCMDEAISQLKHTYNVEIKKEYVDEAYVYGDKYQLVEMCYNILQNSAEAIQMKDADDLKIEVTVMVEDKWICISVYDNGCGMDRKTLKNMFKISYSQKRTYKNWGVGLSHVCNIVEAHNGFLNVKSEFGKYTEIQIALPKLSEKTYSRR